MKTEITVPHSEAYKLHMREYQWGFESGQTPHPDNDLRAENAMKDAYAGDRVKSYWKGYLDAKGKIVL